LAPRKKFRGTFPREIAKAWRGLQEKRRPVGRADGNRKQRGSRSLTSSTPREGMDNLQWERR